MNLFRTVVLIKRKKYETEDSILYEAKNPKRVALVLDDIEDKILVATFTHAKEGILEDNFTLKLSQNEELFGDMRFENMIYLIPKSNIVKYSLDKLPFDLMNAFMKKLRVNRLNNMKTEDYLALLEVFTKFNKKLIRPGSVIITLNEGIYKTYFIDKIVDDEIVAYPLIYKNDEGLSLQSFESEVISLRQFLIDTSYFEEQEERIRNVIEDHTLKLISGRGIKK